MAAEREKFLAVLIIKRPDLFAEECQVCFLEVEPARQQAQGGHGHRRIAEFLVRHLLRELLTENIREL